MEFREPGFMLPAVRLAFEDSLLNVSVLPQARDICVLIIRWPFHGPKTLSVVCLSSERPSADL